MNIAEPWTVLKAELLQNLVPQVLEVLTQALHEGRAVHVLESQLWELALQLGRRSLAAFFDASGTGNLGATLSLPDGHTAQRLERQHSRRYVSIFGEFRLQRVVYGSREKQKIEFVPLDNCWQMPESVYSYVLQDWDQALCVEQAFGQAAHGGANPEAEAVGGQPGDTNQEMAKDVTNFMLTQPLPEEEGEDRGGQRRSERDRDATAGGRSASAAAHRTKGTKPARSGWPPWRRCIRWTATGARRRKWWRPCFAMHPSQAEIGPNRTTRKSGPACRGRCPLRQDRVGLSLDVVGYSCAGEPKMKQAVGVPGRWPGSPVGRLCQRGAGAGRWTSWTCCT